MTATSHRAGESAGASLLGRLRGVSPLWIVGAITLLAAILRFDSLTSQSYWIDESITAHELHGSLGTMLHNIHVYEATPPLYFIVAWVWTQIFGTGEAGLRSLSALAGIALVPVTYLAGRELVSRWAGCAAALIVAISPFTIWYSQEGRAYMLLGLFCGASLWRWAVARRDPARGNLGWWVLASGLAIFTHPFALFLVVPEAVWLLWLGRSRRDAWIACGVLVVVGLGLLPFVGGNSYLLNWVKAFSLHTRIEQVPVDLGLGTLYQSSLVTSGLLGTALLLAIVAAVIVVGGRREEHQGALVALVFAAVVLLVPVLAAQVGSDYIVPRNFMPAFVPLAIIFGAAITAPRARMLGAGLGLLVAFGLIYADVRISDTAAYQRPDWRGLAHALGRPAGTRAVIANSGTFASQPLSVFLPGTEWSWNAVPADERPVRITEVDIIGSAYQELASPLPTGVRLIGSRTLDGYSVRRFSVSPRTGTPQVIETLAGQFLASATPLQAGAAVLIQR